ncbi:MAG: hypothetical protein VXX85_03670, partial [Candidatus Margulisiibacteriota bacterium]|nr:hypothetical protein [Candidatus Margulisiibacteriota bacterium]
DFTQFSLVSLISFQLLLLVSDICFSRSKNVEKNERVSTVANLKERIGDGGPDFQKMNAKDIAREYLQAINERLTRKYFVKDYASSLVKAGLGIPLAIIRSRSGECIYENQPSSMISNYFLMAAVVDFFTSKFDQKAWTECLSGHGYNAITNANLVHQLATVLVEAKNDTNTGDQTIQDFIDIVHSPVKLMNMWKMVAHVLPIAVPATFLILLNREEYSTCKDDRYYKDLFWALPLAMAVFKGVFDMFLYPTELAVHKKDELGRFADRILGDGSGADPELGNGERAPLMAARVDEIHGDNGLESQIIPVGQATMTEQEGGETKGVELTGTMVLQASGDVVVSGGLDEKGSRADYVEGFLHTPNQDGVHDLIQPVAESKSTTRLPTVNSKRFERNM